MKKIEEEKRLMEHHRFNTNVNFCDEWINNDEDWAQRRLFFFGAALNLKW